MNRINDALFVKSHVSRDLLQSAGLFKTDKLVVWEYVSNGLQYVDSGTNPIVKVTLDSKRKRITVTDNGRGMDWSGLQNFFVMHGENLDRKAGRMGRGRFGTGKSAAFGIADLLRIITVRYGRRSVIELSRADIDRMKSEDPIPVRTLERESPTDAPNGTTVEIEGIHLKTLDQAGIIHYIERHLARWSKNVTVFVNHHECEFAEPPVARELSFTPDESSRDILGDATLTVKVSKSPLDEELRGVSIFSNGVWHETTLAGNEGRDMAQYLFGEIDIPKLDDDSSPISPFDMSRSMRLNVNNETVQAIYAFVGRSLDRVRRDLVEADKKRKSEEEARKLARQASEIAKVINEDFDDYRQKVAKAKARATGGSDPYALNPAASSLEDLLFGSDLPATETADKGDPGASDGRDGGGTEPPDFKPKVSPGPQDAEKKGRPAGQNEGKLRPRGGFDVKFQRMGADSFRAQYLRDERAIYINLDHPQLEAARGLGSIEDPAFRRLAYEVAFSEYAVALASELAARDEYLDPSDPIVDIRETLNRVARKGATLYTQK